jgi:hypothetical protein
MDNLPSLNVVVAVAQLAITSLLAVVTTIYVRITGRTAVEATRSRQASVFLQVDQILVGLRGGWRRLQQLPSDFRRWTPEEEIIARDVSADLNRVANLWMQGLFEIELLGQAWGQTIAGIWEIVEPWVDHRKMTTNLPDHRTHIEHLVKELQGQSAAARRERSPERI